MKIVQINSRNVPREEWEAVSHLERHLRGLQWHVEEFSAAVALLRHADELSASCIEQMCGYFRRGESVFNLQEKVNLNTYRNWQFIAAEHASVTVAKFWDRLNAVRYAVIRCPSISKDVDIERFDNEKAAFSAMFPDRKEVRDGYAHSVDKEFTPEKAKRNSSELSRNAGSISGEKFSIDVDGRTVWSSVSKETLSLLGSIVDGVFLSFAKVLEEQSPFEQAARL